MILPLSFYQNPQVTEVAKMLLGKRLVTVIDGHRTAGIIVETEAYAGITDRACHAFGGRRTARTEIMYASGGVSYVYRCYGIHQLLNVVTNDAGVPDAVLIRAIEPDEGLTLMLQRRGMEQLLPMVTSGPGMLTQALGIGAAHNGLSLQTSAITIHETDVCPSQELIVATTRVGVAAAGDDAYLPYRFYLANNKYVSKRKGLPLRTPNS